MWRRMALCHRKKNKLYLFVSYLRGLAIADETCPLWQETLTRDAGERIRAPYEAGIEQTK